jgi:radical SAM-linked protein
MPRYRLEYAKNGTARFLSHRELMTSLQRALRRASFPLSYSKGYNPRPKLSFGPPLGVGVAGLREYMDLELTEGINVEDHLNCLNCQLLPGIRANSRFLDFCLRMDNSDQGKISGRTWRPITVSRPK